MIRIHKGAAGEMDQFKTQGLQINYTESDRPMTVLKDFYHDVKDLDPIMIGDAVWPGILAVNANVPLIVLWITKPHQIQIFLYPNMERESVSFEEADVQMIISSIKTK